jgi:hypothetical protein
MKKKNPLNDLELISVKAMNADGTYEEMLKKEMLTVEIPKDIFDSVVDISKKVGAPLEKVVEMFLRAGLVEFEKKLKKYEK